MLKEFTELNKKTIEFVKTYVFPKLNIRSWDQVDLDSIGNIVDYMVDNFEVPLSQDETADKVLLNKASDAITDITTQKWW